MTFEHLLRIVENSSASDWHCWPDWNAVGRDCGREQGPNHLRCPLRDKLCVYRPNMNISLATDVTVQADFEEPWVQYFSDPRASLVAVQLRYCDVIVHQCGSVAVDGGRCLMPLPQVDRNGVYQVPRGRLPLARLLFELHDSNGAIGDINTALTRARVAVV